MITPEEVGLLARPISQHIDHAQLSAYIAEAEQLIIRPAIGDYLFGNVKVNTEYYGIILNGGKDVYGNVCGGLRKALAYYVYARFIKEGATIATRFGAVEKTDEYSARIEQDRKNEIYRECTAMADTYLQEVVAYAKTRGWMTANKVGRIRKTAYVIGDSPANEEEPCYRNKSSNNGGNESGGAVGDIYAGEGINIKDNVISVDMAEVRSGTGVASLENKVTNLTEDVEALKNNNEEIAAGEGLAKDGSVLSVDFSKVASAEATNEALSIAKSANQRVAEVQDIAQKATEKANTAMQQSQEAGAKADEAYNKAMTATDTANTAYNEAQEAKVDAEQALDWLSAKADKTDLGSYAKIADLDNYATTSMLDNKADKSALANFATTEQLAEKADKTELSSYATKEDVNILIETINTQLSAI